MPKNYQKEIARVHERNRTVVFCLPGKEFSGIFLQSFIKLIYWCWQNGINAHVRTEYAPNIYSVRNVLLELGRLTPLNEMDTPFGGNLQYDYTMWIDSDMVFEPEDFKRLLDARKDIVSGLTQITTEAYNACLKFDVEEMKQTGRWNMLGVDEVPEELFKVE